MECSGSGLARQFTFHRIRSDKLDVTQQIPTVHIIVTVTLKITQKIKWWDFVLVWERSYQCMKP